MVARTSRALVLLALAGASSVPRVAEAQTPDDAAFAREIENKVVAHPHTIAELEAGVIALPSAPISAAQRGGSTPLIGTIGKGDATVQTGIHVLFRGSRDWAIGAGALFAPRPTADTEYGGSSGLQRTHARSYLFLGTEARYIPIHYKWIEAYVGGTIGGIIIADRFVTNAGDPVPPILGVKEITVSTEGVGFGLQVGVEWLFSERLVAGLALRGDHWILPSAQQCSPIKDCATLSGGVEALEAGLTIGYRLPL